MERKVLLVFVMVLLIFGITRFSQAALTNIGTASYNGNNYNLIWDADNNGNSVVWLDYTNIPVSWAEQTIWAMGLTQALSNLDTPGYSITWEENQWRLPSTGIKPNNGYNETGSELGHLFYEEFKYVSYYSTRELITSAQLNNSEFDNIIAGWFWSSTEAVTNAGYAWQFNLASGAQYDREKSLTLRGIAIRTGQVAPLSHTPVPGAIWLFGSGLTFLAFRGRKTATRV